MNESPKGRKLAFGGAVLWRRCGAALCALFLMAILSGCAQFPDVRAYEPGMASDPYKEALQLAGAVRSSQTSRETYVYRIQPTDNIEIKVVDYEKMNLTTRVGIDGNIDFPPLGEIQAAGLTQDELEASIEESLRGDYLKEPDIIVFVREATSQNVTVLGEVAKPGPTAVWGEVRLLDVLAQIGGLRETASPIGYLLRKKTASTALPAELAQATASAEDSEGNVFDVFRIYFVELLLHADLDWNISLFPGDILMVPPAGSIYVAGPGIKTPGTYPLSFTPTTLRQFIDEAGGLKIGASRDVVLARNNEEDVTEYVKVNYNKSLVDGNYDIVMEPGDRVVVVTTFWRYTLEFVKDVLTNVRATYRVSDSISTSIGMTRYAIQE